MEFEINKLADYDNPIVKNKALILTKHCKTIEDTTWKVSKLEKI